jgi:hypothetical protein
VNKEDEDGKNHCVVGSTGQARACARTWPTRAALRRLRDYPRPNKDNAKAPAKGASQRQLGRCGQPDEGIQGYNGGFHHQPLEHFSAEKEKAQAKNMPMRPLPRQACDQPSKTREADDGR